MTTATWSSRIRHDSDATFREWGSEFAAKLLAVGMVQTADTGQINWTTVTLPGNNVDAGYEIWRFDDAQQSTAPIYFKVTYGTMSGAASNPRLKLTVGTGSNGSGTITGTALTATSIFNANAAQTSNTLRSSYMCGVAGLLWCSWKVSSGSDGSFYICRTCDTDGVADALGAQVYWGSGSVSSATARQSLRFTATAAAYTAQTGLVNAAVSLSPMIPTSGAIGSDIQVFLAWTITPRPLPMIGVVGIVTGDFTAASTFSATPIGSTARTYFVAQTTFGPIGPKASTDSGGLSHALIWE